jgi:hypothetical protein
MISVGFARVSKKRPCRICGKPTYFGFSRDEGTSICMRVSAGSRGLSRNGGNIHVHTEIPFIAIQPRIKRPISQSIPLAPAEIRDAVFRELIKISPASNYREELVTGPGGLLSLIQRYSRFMKSPHPVEQEKAEVELNQLMDRIRVITEATLLTTGFHTHKRQWRKMRNG